MLCIEEGEGDGLNPIAFAIEVALSKSGSVTVR